VRLFGIVEDNAVHNAVRPELIVIPDATGGAVQSGIGDLGRFLDLVYNFFDVSHDSVLLSNNEGMVRMGCGAYIKQKSSVYTVRAAGWICWRSTSWLK
jgi:hypothetical protein